MTQVAAAFTRDANNVPIQGLGFTESKAISYSELTTGAVGITSLFTVTGVVSIRVFGVCGNTLVGAATLEVGIVGSTASVLAQIADATTLATD